MRNSVDSKQFETQPANVANGAQLNSDGLKAPSGVASVVINEITSPRVTDNADPASQRFYTADPPVENAAMASASVSAADNVLNQNTYREEEPEMTGNLAEEEEKEVV